MKDVLEYTKEELEALSTDELAVLHKKAEYQESLFDTRQLVEKLAINSLYGALGNRWFPLFNQDIARAITGNGRYFIHKLANYIDDELQSREASDKSYVIYGDTDSVYYQIAPFMKVAENLDIQKQTDYADGFEKKIIQPVIKKTIEDFAWELNAANADVIGAEREIIADKGVFVAKKKYFARVIDSEGVRYAKPKTKVMGLELIRSSTPVFSRKHLKNSIEIILDSTKEEMQSWVDTMKTQYYSAPLGDIAASGGVSNMDYTLGQKAVPIGARSALLHNKYIEENGLLEQFSKINAGDKTKRMYLQEPNPLHANIVAFTDDRFIEIFREYIDYDTNFEKGFLKPLEIMTDALNWDLRKTTEVLDDW